MTATFYIAALVLTAALYAVIRGHAHPLLRIIALGAGLIAIPYAFYGESLALSRPKPQSLEWSLRHIETATIEGAVIREGEGIYLWLIMDAVPEPRYYVIPWDQKLAEQLQSAMREARDGAKVIMRLPFEPSLDAQKLKFYSLPPPIMTPKPADPPPVVIERDA